MNDENDKEIISSFSDTPIPALGHYKLRCVELVQQLIKIGGKTIQDILGASNIFSIIMRLVEKFPWNNFLQIKVISIFEDIVEKIENEEFRKNVLKESQLLKYLVKFTEKASFIMGHDNSRETRNGQMALVIKLGNMIQKNRDREEIKEAIEEIEDDWEQFVSDELKIQVELQEMDLGGSQTNNDNEDEGDGPQSMENIMGRFANYSQNSSQSEEDDEEEEQQPIQEIHVKEREDPELENNTNKIIEIDEGKMVANLDNTCLDNNYWKTPVGMGYNLEDLLNEK